MQGFYCLFLISNLLKRDQMPKKYLLSDTATFPTNLSPNVPNLTLGTSVHYCGVRWQVCWNILITLATRLVGHLSLLPNIASCPVPEMSIIAMPCRFLETLKSDPGKEDILIQSNPLPPFYR